MNQSSTCLPDPFVFIEGCISYVLKHNLKLIDENSGKYHYRFGAQKYNGHNEMIDVLQ